MPARITKGSTARKTCLVTGGLGFIGSNLVDKLVEAGHRVVVVDNLSTGNTKNANPAAAYETFSVMDEGRLRTTVKSVQPNWIFHLAALARIQPSFDEPESHDDTNVRACLSLIRVCREFPVQAVVYSSSSAVYGNPEIFPTPEEAPVAPLSPYALQKYAGERYLHIFGRKFNVPVTSLRYFNVYGPRSFDSNNPYNAYTSVVGIFFHQAMRGVPLTVTGDGLQERDFVHVWDVADANICLATNIDRSIDKVFNVGTGQKISVLRLAQIFEREYQFIAERSGEARITHADVSKLKALGWVPSVQLLDAIRRKIV